nr:reverse transcriptase domain-containing protein [Tanacetum cinerariifolium]
ILCGEKKVRIPLKNKALIIEGDKNQSRLKISSCIKARKYIENTGTVSKVKRVEDVPIICDFPEVFLEDLPGLSSPRQVEFRIDLVPGATPMARAPYRLAPSELKELSKQLKELSEKGHVIDNSGIHVDSAKIEAIKSWAAPTTPTERKLCSAPILSLPEGSEDFVVYCDANAQAKACEKENIGAEGFIGEGEPFDVRADGTKYLRG